MTDWQEHLIIGPIVLPMVIAAASFIAATSRSASARVAWARAARRARWASATGCGGAWVFWS